MKGKFFHVFWYVGNDPNERGFYVRANSAQEVWDAIVDKLGEDEAEDYDVMEYKGYSCPKSWAQIKNGRIVYEDEDYGPIEWEGA